MYYNILHSMAGAQPPAAALCPHLAPQLLSVGSAVQDSMTEICPVSILCPCNSALPRLVLALQLFRWLTWLPQWTTHAMEMPVNQL